jgi:predicted permease
MATGPLYERGKAAVPGSPSRDPHDEDVLVKLFGENRFRQAWGRVGTKVSWSTPGRDVKYAFRSLAGSPGFSLVVVLTIALGIGVNTAVFSLVHSLVLEPLPFPGGDRMVQLWRYEEIQGRGPSLVSPARPMAAAWQAEPGLFDAVGGYTEEEFHLALDEGVVSVRGARVSPEILSMVSARPRLGRLFAPSDCVPGPADVILLSEETWTTRFGADPGVVGRSLTVGGTPHVVVGVIPRSVRRVLESGFFGAREKEVLLPLVADPAGGWAQRPNVVARVRPGLSLEDVQSRLDAIQPRVAPLIEGHSEWFPLVRSAREALSPQLRRGLWTVFGAVAVVLLIAGANIATLLLVRRVAREGEMKVRLALGATRARLAGQLFTEALVLGAAGIVLAVLTARWSVDGAVWIAGSALPEIRGARLDLTVLGFAVVAGLVTMILFSLVPIVQLGRLSPAEAMTRPRPKETRQAVGWAAHRFLAIVQVALATVLVIWASLVSGSLGRLLAVNPGVDTDGLAAVELTLPRDRYEAGIERIALFDQVVEGIGDLPGVEAVGWARFVPPRLAGAVGRIDVEGRAPDEGAGAEPHAGNWVSPTYFRAVGASFPEGRAFTPAEIADRAQVVILNRSAADRLWPDGGGGVGSRIRLDSDYGPSPWMTVVGIVPDVKAWWLGDAPERIQVYLPVSDVPPRSGVLLVRGAGDLAAMAAMVQRQVRRLDPSLPIGQAYWVRDAFRQTVARQRFQALVLSSFGLVGVLLAVLGVYGIFSLSVTRRTREIGVRLALGATRGDVSRQMLGQGLRAVAAGAAAGLALSWVSSGFLAQLLWGIEATDPPTYLACAATVVLAGLAATWTSTRRALGIDPMQALKQE